MFRNTGANAFAKNQMRLAYEDKRDLYCTIGMIVNVRKGTSVIPELTLCAVETDMQIATDIGCVC